MCVVSFVGDHYGRKLSRDYPWISPPNSIQPVINPTYPVTPQEFQKLKREVEELRELLKGAKQYDEENGEPDCEMDAKVEFLRKIAEFVGVDLDEVFGAT